MSDHAEGGGGLDPNSDAGFNALLAQQAGAEVPEGVLEALEDSDTTVAAGLTTEESTQERPRDELGRFAPAAQQPEEPEGAAPEPQTDPWANVSPELREEFERTRQERDHAQTLIGRQSGELGELRQAQARLEGRLEEMSRHQAAPQAPAVPPDLDRLSDLYAQRGPQGMMGWVIDNAPGWIEEAEDLWALDDPQGAREFTKARLQHEAAFSQPAPAAPAAPAPSPLGEYAPFLEQMKLDHDIAATLGEVRGQVGAEWDVVKDHLVPVLEADETPAIIKNAVASPDEATRLQGMTALVQLARGRAIAQATAQVSDRQKAERDAALKSGALRVAGGSQRPVAQRQPASPQEMTSEERQEAFRKALLATETTSVSDGLTFGPAH